MVNRTAHRHMRIRYRWRDIAACIITCAASGALTLYLLSRI